MAKRTEFTDQDKRLMAEALALARRGVGRTSPNPLVGAVIVRRGEVVGRGYHRRAGANHAEVVALSRAGVRAKGASLYVNLEPCCHHGRTPPCTDAILASGVRRVIVGMLDPNPLVNGKGIGRLRRAGIEVSTGLMAAECRAANEGFWLAMKEHRPRVTFKSALTLDGRVATRSGNSRWVSGSESRRVAHRLRSEHDAILVGVDTVLADDPRLTCRGVRGGRDPLRVVVDSRLRTPTKAALVRLAAESSAPTWIFATRAASPRRVQALQRAGVEVIQVAAQRQRVDVKAMLAQLARRGVHNVLLEGGPTLAGSLWRAQTIDRVAWFIAPRVLADPQALPVVWGPPVARMADAHTLRDVSVRRLGQDLLIDGRLRWRG